MLRSIIKHLFVLSYIFSKFTNIELQSFNKPKRCKFIHSRFPWYKNKFSFRTSTLSHCVNHLSAQKENKHDTDYELMHVLTPRWHQSHFSTHDYIILCDMFSIRLHGSCLVKQCLFTLFWIPTSTSSCNFEIQCFFFRVRFRWSNFFLFYLLAVPNLRRLRC